LRKISAEGYAVMSCADVAARLKINDHDTKTCLLENISASPRAARDALTRLSGYRESFEFDRAYRLLEAATLGRDVEPIDRKKADLFAREAELGWISLDEAFGRIVSLVPELDDLRVDIETAVTQTHAMD
jgi:hypothetical protein